MKGRKSLAAKRRKTRKNETEKTSQNADALLQGSEIKIFFFASFAPFCGYQIP